MIIYVLQKSKSALKAQNSAKAGKMQMMPSNDTNQLFFLKGINENPRVIATYLTF